MRALNPRHEVELSVRAARIVEIGAVQDRTLLKREDREVERLQRAVLLLWLRGLRYLLHLSILHSEQGRAGLDKANSMA